jgi:hypothetical protein
MTNDLPEPATRGRRSGARVLFAAAWAIGSVFALSAPAAASAATNPALSGAVSNSGDLAGATSVATSGTYAYTTAYFAGQLVAIDIANPNQPSVAGESVSATSLLDASTVNISGGYAYVASKNRNGALGSGSNDDGSGNSLTILDIATNPAKPTIVGTLHDSINLFGAYGVAVSGQYAYVAAQGCLTAQPCPNPAVGNSFAVVDVGSPTSPKIVATLHNNNLPAPWAGSGALNHACSVAVAGNYAYVTAAYSDRLTVIDISDPLHPQIVASLHDSNYFAFDVDVAVRGGYAYVADQSSGLGRLTVVDVHTPSAPRIVGSLTNSTWLNGAYRVRLRGNFAYVSATYAHALAAVDISDPAHPRLAGGYSSSSDLTRTTGLDVDASGRFLIGTSPYLSTQSPSPYPPYPLQPGGPTVTGTVSVVDLDSTPIAVAIDAPSKPSNPTTQTSANFTFTVSDAVSSVQCQLDGAPPGACTSPSSQTYTSLGSGSHTFTVAATDAAGNTVSDSYTWAISSGAPSPTATLSLSVAGSGLGSVVSTPAGISCPGSCSHRFALGTSVTLTATPDRGSEFTGWGGACAGTGTCKLSMNVPRSVSADFSSTAPALRPVPNVLGKRLKAAKHAIKAAGFRVGKITFRFSAKAKKGRVIFQRPKPGKHLKRGARVNMVVSKGRR